MARQIIYFIIASILVVLLAKYLAVGLTWVQDLHHYLLALLDDVFAGGTAGSLLRKTLSLLLIAPAVLLLPVAAYWLIHRKPLPRLMTALWGIWLVAATIIVLGS